MGISLIFPLVVHTSLLPEGCNSSTDVVGEAILDGSVMKAGEVTESLFFITHTVLFSRLEKGSFFLALIFAYIPWSNFFVISAKEKHLLGKKKREK